MTNFAFFEITQKFLSHLKDNFELFKANYVIYIWYI